LFSRGDVDYAELVQIGVGIIAFDFENFRDEPASRTPLDLYNNIKGISDVGFNGSVRKLDSALQDTTGEAREPLSRGAGVNCG
jgi:hypothetical protein